MEKDNKKHNTNTATKKPTTKENKTDNKKNVSPFRQKRQEIREKAANMLPSCY